MLNRLRANLGVSSALVAMLLLEVVALRSKSAGTIILLAFCGLLAVLVLVRADVRKIAMGAALACSFTLTWNGWFLGPLRPGDALILLTIGLILIANPNDGFRTPPWWVKQAAIAIVVVALLAVFFPISPEYLANRTVLDAQGRLTVDTEDWRQPGYLSTYWQNRIYSRATSPTYAHPIILMHDAKGLSVDPVSSYRRNTAVVVTRVIRFYKARGYVFTDPAGRRL